MAIPLDTLDQNVTLVFFSICDIKIYNLLSCEMPLRCCFKNYKLISKDRETSWTLQYIKQMVWRKMLNVIPQNFIFFFKEKHNGT